MGLFSSAGVALKVWKLRTDYGAAIRGARCRQIPSRTFYHPVCRSPLAGDAFVLINPNQRHGPPAGSCVRSALEFGVSRTASFAPCWQIIAAGTANFALHALPLVTLLGITTMAWSGGRDFSHQIQEVRETFGKYRPERSVKCLQEPARGRYLRSDQLQSKSLAREQAPACGRHLTLAFRVVSVLPPRWRHGSSRDHGRGSAFC